MNGPNWKAVNAAAIATQCSPRHVQSVIEDAQRDIEELRKALFALRYAHTPSEWDAACQVAEALLARIGGGAA